MICEMPFPVRQVKVDPLALRLSAARNRAAAVASGEALVFLDIDCIPAPDCLRDYQKGLDDCDGLLMGEVMYLPAGASKSGWTYAGFEQNCARHSDRRGPPAEGVEICSDYRCFWSLNFAIRRDRFMRRAASMKPMSAMVGKTPITPKASHSPAGYWAG
ncbi:glycosyltransferase [Asaia platycodi]|uniref:glycosyltransferase n=1 Tax=Asaia platycodi TaxID=610243 RepID=UPI000AC505FB|nr:glycosyltransferase [Asaia platycodi]